MTKYSSRKFILCVLNLLVSAWLLWEHLIDASTYKALVLGTVGAYIIGNVASKMVTKQNDNP